MLRAASPSLTPTGRVPLSILTILLIMFGYTCTVSAAGPFWALHHAVQPGRLRAISVSLVNALGNIGGFVGPVALGALHDALGPRCPPGTDDCVAQWGWGTTLLSGTVMLILSGVATVAATRIYAKAETMPLNQW
jgi:MFS family permease